MDEPRVLTLIEYVEEIRSGSIQAEDFWRACSTRIERLNSRLNAFITRLDQSDLATSTLTPAARAGGVLAGAPIAVKDVFETAGVRTTAGSLFFKDHVPASDAHAVARLRSAGGRVIGKTNTHEIALGVTTANPHFGTTRNPWDTARIPGGSSGGSAVAVATGMALVALGTDTGGSIRIPASLCGVVGLKPTYGRVSLRGVIPLSWNLDHVGPLTQTVADAALMLEIMAKPDGADPTSNDHAMGSINEHLDAGINKWRVLIAGGAYVEDCDAEVLKAVRDSGSIFRDLGASLETRDLSWLRDAAIANGAMTQADAATFHLERLATEPHLFGEDVRSRLEAGRALSVSDYVLARRTQVEARHRLVQVFEEFDVVLLPSTPITAPLIEGVDAVEQARRLTRFTAPFNLTGVPAVSIPCGFSRNGLPIGLQLVAAPWSEARLLQAARAYERATNWRSRRPPVL